MISVNLKQLKTNSNILKQIKTNQNKLMQIKPDALRTFVVVADCGTLAEAADVLNRTPSAISMTLKQFTAHFGAELFETDRKSTLTPFGRFVLEEGRRALNDFEESMRNIREHAEGEMGSVRLATVPSVATRMLPERVEKFQQRYPKVRLELRDLDSSLVAEAVRNGSVDLGIASLTSAAHDLVTGLLLEEPFGVVCRADHPLARRKKAIKWKDLENVKLISNGLNAMIKDPDFARLSANTTMHIHNTSTLLGFVEQGMGVTLLPKMALPQQGSYHFLPLADKSAVRRLYFLQHRQHRLSPAALAFKRHIVERV